MLPAAGILLILRMHAGFQDWPAAEPRAKPPPAPAALPVVVPAAARTPAPPMGLPASHPIAEVKVATLPTATDLLQLQSDLTMPVVGVHAQDLRDTFNEMRGKRRHLAVDILAAKGTTVLSATTGRIIQISSSKSGGLMVFATDARERFMLLYAHLDHYAKGLKVGPVRRGQVIGYVGTTGNAPASAPHLHFALAWSGGSLRWSRALPIDPRPLLAHAEGSGPATK